MNPSVLARAALALLPLALPATNLRPLPDGYTRRVWQTQDGLPENTVQAFAQTPDNYLWIGTKGGLVRFDGAGFVVFDHDNTPAIQEDSIFCLTLPATAACGPARMEGACCAIETACFGPTRPLRG